MRAAHFAERRRCLYGPSVVLDVLPTYDGFGCLLGVVCSVFARNILIWGRAPTRDAPTESPIISGIFVGVGLVPTREPKPQQSLSSISIYSLEARPS
jgi:hypothetical protein